MNLYAIKAIYLFELARTWRTLLQSIATPVTVSYTHLDVYKRQVIASDRLPDHPIAATLQRLADAFATGHFATADVPGIVLEQHQVAGEKGGVGAAQVEQHAVMAGYRNDLHLDDSGCAAASGFVHLGWGLSLIHI